MRVLFRAFNGTEDWAWCNEHVHLIQAADTGGIMAIDEEKNEPVGAVITESWTANSVQCHIIITNPLVLRHKFLECVANYVFVVRGVSRMYAFITSDNKKSVKLVKHIGFTLKATLEEAFNVGIDYLLMELKRENCKFIDKAARDGTK